MKFQTLALDYDGTLAEDGHVDPATIQALHRWRDSGRRLVLVTGRRLEPLLDVFSHTGMFESIVIENGAVIYEPAKGDLRPLALPPPADFLEQLRGAEVPFETGQVIVATNSPYDRPMLEIIQSLGLDWAITYNKGAVMALPGGVDKTSGLQTVLAELNLSPSTTIGVGDAENDEGFLRSCGMSVAVGNALPALKEMADLVTSSERGAGVVELIDRILQNGSLDPEKPD